MAGDPDTFRVSPSLTQLPMVVAPSVEDAGPQQLAAAGQAITGAGRVAATLYEDHLKEVNSTRVTEAMTQLTETRNELTYGENGWASQTGKNALERPDGKSLDEEFGGEFDSHISTIEQGLGNDAQRRMFRENAQRMSLELRGRIQGHTTEQGRTYALETQAGLVDTASRQLAMAQTPEEIEEARALIGRGANNIFSIKGTPTEAQGETMRSLLTPGHLAQLTGKLDADDIDGAEAYLNEYGDDLTPEAFTKVHGAIVEQRAIIGGENFGEEVWNTHQGEAAAAAPQDVLMPYVGNFTAANNFNQQRPGHRHAGRDIAMPTGTAVRAGADGTIRVKSDPDGYGKYVDLVLDNGTVLRMAHLSETLVEDGARVQQGQTIAKSGSTGRSTGPHLHYEVRVGGKPTDPIEWHQGRPKTEGRATTTGSSLSDMLQAIDEDDTKTPKEKQYAKQIVKERWSARDADEGRTKEQINSRAIAEIDSTGRISAATRSAAVGAGFGDLIPSWRSFEKATQERRSGKPVDGADGLETYGRVAIGIANGEVTSYEKLLQFKPFLSDSQFKQLTDSLVKAPHSAQEKASEILGEMQGVIKGNPIFIDDKGKTDQKRYHGFVGSVISTIEGRELATGKPVTKDERREIVLGLLAADTVGGKPMHNFEVRQLYDNIPPRARLESTRSLQRHGVANPDISDVVDVWNRLTTAQRKAYGGE